MASFPIEGVMGESTPKGEDTARVEGEEVGERVPNRTIFVVPVPTEFASVEKLLLDSR